MRLLQPLTLVLPSAIVLSCLSAIAQTNNIPPNQQRPPATFEQYPYRPACEQLSAVPGGTSAWLAWGPVVDGVHQNWRGIAAATPTDNVYSQLAAVGLCVEGGAVVPLSLAESSAANNPTDTKPKSLLQQRAAAAKSRANESEGGGALFVLLLLGAGGFWYYRQDQKNDDFGPLLSPADLQQSRRDSYRPPPLHLEVSKAFEPEESGDRSHPTTAAPVADSRVPQNPAQLLAQRKRSTLITAKPRVGKSLSIANAWPTVQQDGTTVWTLQPKYCPREAHYWDGADHLFGLMLENWQTPPDSNIGIDLSALIDGERTEQIDKEALAKALTNYLLSWRHDPAPNKLLIVDELRALKEVLPEWYNSFFAPFMVVEMSSGETAGRIVWVISQSPNCSDIGFSGGDRSMFDLFALETPESSAHYNALRQSFRGLPAAEKSLYGYSQSPKRAIFYHSALGNWAAMTRLPDGRSDVSMGVHHPGSSRLTKRDAATSHTSAGSAGVSGESAQYTRAEVDLLNRVSESVSCPFNVLVAALDAIKRGAAKTQVVEQVLEMGGRRFGEGAAIYEQLKSAIAPQ